jgi:hypothetical protein
MTRTRSSNDDHGPYAHHHDSGTSSFPEDGGQVGGATDRHSPISTDVSRAVEATPPPDSGLPAVRVSTGETEGSTPTDNTDKFEGPLRTLVSIGANITVLTALLVFFGWKRAEAHSQMLGIDESILGMSPQDYAFRSVNALFPLLAVIAVAGLGWLWVHAGIARSLQDGRQQRSIYYTARVFVLAWLWIPGICALFSWQFPATGFLMFPLSFAAGTLLTCYGLYLRSQLQGSRARSSPAWHTSLTKVFVAIVVTLSLFWEVSNYATVIGQDLGSRLTTELPSRAQVVVYSPKRLNITAPGVKEEAFEGVDNAYRFRYTGLRFLNYTGGRYVLVSDGWTPRYGVVILVSDKDPVRLEFVHGLQPSASPNP